MNKWASIIRTRVIFEGGPYKEESSFEECENMP